MDRRWMVSLLIIIYEAYAKKSLWSTEQIVACSIKSSISRHAKLNPFTSSLWDNPFMHIMRCFNQVEHLVIGLHRLVWNLMSLRQSYREYLSSDKLHLENLWARLEMFKVKLQFIHFSSITRDKFSSLYPTTVFIDFRWFYTIRSKELLIRIRKHVWPIPWLTIWLRYRSQGLLDTG